MSKPTFNAKAMADGVADSVANGTPLERSIALAVLFTGFSEDRAREIGDSDVQRDILTNQDVALGINIALSQGTTTYLSDKETRLVLAVLNAVVGKMTGALRS